MKPYGRHEGVERAAEYRGRDGKLEGGEERREADRCQDPARETREHGGAKRRDANGVKAAGGLYEQGIAGGMRAAGPEVEAQPHGADEEHLVPFPGVGRERERPGEDEQSPRGRRECEGWDRRTALQLGRV